MQFTDEVKQTILDLLNAGNRQGALDFIAKTYDTTQYDANLLLEAFERQYQSLLTSVTNKKPEGSSCAGCLSGTLQVIAILIALSGILTLAAGYFFGDLFGDSWNSRRVPVVVTGLYYPYNDSAYVRIIFEYEKEYQVKSDTGIVDYDSAYIHIGDTTEVYASDIGLGLGEEDLQTIAESQRVFYFIGGSILIIALIFWMVSFVFRARPPKVRDTRYSK